MNKKPSRRRSNLSQFDLIHVPDGDDAHFLPTESSDYEISFEEEMASLSSGGGGPRKPRKRAPVPIPNLDALIAASLRDVTSDDDGSGDDDDPELLNELRQLELDDQEDAPPPRSSRPAPPPPGASAESSTISLLQDRIANYTQAERAAKESGEISRARRFGRGLKTLNDLLKQAKAGRPVPSEDIPPPVSLGKPASAGASSLPAPLVPRRVAPPPVSPEPEQQPKPEPEPEPEPQPEPEPEQEPENEEPPIAPEPAHPPPLPPRAESQGVDPSRLPGLQIIQTRKEEFKNAALTSRHEGQKALALEYLKVAKQFEIVLEAYKAGQEMDLNELPTPRMIYDGFMATQKKDEQIQGAAEPVLEPLPPEDLTLIKASTMDEALKQRLAYFQEQQSKAKIEGNVSKLRRMGRIVKQYQDAIKMHAAGKPIAVDELPTPIGYAPLPDDSKPYPRPSRPGPGTARAADPILLGSPSGAPAKLPSPNTSNYNKQLSLLLNRQKEFRDAALEAKKAGHMEQAKEFLRAAKGFDAVLAAARGGLLVDLHSLPLPPRDKLQIEHTFDMVSADDCNPAEDASIELGDEDITARLLRQLAGQLKLCLANRDHYKAMGNIAESNRFEHLAVSVKQDLDVVTVASSQNPPKFHYESRQFSVVQCNTDLNENDLELTIVRGIAYNVTKPKEVDTYVKFEFPFPQDAPVCERTGVVKDTSSPQYGAVFPLPIQRSARACLRVFKRHALRCQVYSRGGWFSRDELLGTVQVKLAPLETQVTIHEAFPLMDGRRAAGGSLEVKLRVRTPLLQQQFENTTHRWLVIDN